MNNESDPYADARVGPSGEQRGLLNQLELNEKLVEPDKNTRDYLTRNVMLGNVKQKDFDFLMYQHQVGQRFLEMPGNEGGYYVGHWMGSTIHEEIQYIFTAGLSIDATGRILLNSKFNRQQFKDETPQGGLNALVPKKNSN